MAQASFICLLDANVLFPFTLRDTLLRAAERGYYDVRWSAQILDEAGHNLVDKGFMTADQFARLRAVMERVFPDAAVTGHEGIAAGLKNQEGDRHVVAAAIVAGAQVIVTSNIKHFAPLPDGIEAQTPDVFLRNLFDLDPGGFIELLRDQAADLSRPPATFEELLERLARMTAGFVAAVREHLASR